jgi:SAM-dependent methyltransferase
MTHCPLCRSDRLATLPMYYRFQDTDFDLKKCKACRILFVDPQPDETTITNMYDKNYFESDYRCGHNVATAFEVKQSELPSWFSRVHLPEKARILEIGCATGYTLSAFRNRGYDCMGIEISEEAAQFARKEFSLSVQTTDIGRAVLEDKSFDLIYLLDVFEHLADPAGSLQRITRWLSPSGAAVFVIPTQTNTIFSRIGMFSYSLLGKRTHIHLPPYHLFEYRPDTFRNLLRANGFSNIQLKPAIMRPSEIGLRSSGLQNFAKKAFHYPNYALTGVFKIWGDRLEVIARL